MKKIFQGIIGIVVLGMAMGICSAASKGHGEWGYSGAAGPEHWGDLSAEYGICKLGIAQSPIDIDGTIPAELEDIEFSYKDAPLRIINNGHCIQVNYAPGSSAFIDEEWYELLQFHFHAPSEHAVKGELHEMEAHLVHKDGEGNLAVVGVFLKEGKRNSFIKKLWDNLPDDVGHEKNVSGVTVNAEELLPKNRDYYHYYGSLTTPPCSEGVNWSVMKHPVEVSKAQIKRFEQTLGFANNRPVQPVGKRFVLESR